MPLIALNRGDVYPSVAPLGRRGVAAAVSTGVLSDSAFKVFHKLLNGVRIRKEVCVKDNDKLTFRVGVLQCLLKGSSFKTFSIVSMKYLYFGVLFPFLQDLYSFICAVICYYYLV